jgi:GNAT superfamily N-acetyltransferase
MEYRTVQIGDEEAIRRVKESAWPDEIPNQQQIYSVLQDPTHQIYLVVSDGEVVGFVDGFLTVSASGVRRWEVDLLAVHPDYRGQGIATQLVEHSTRIGTERGASLARALVQVDNIASQRAFARCAFTTDGMVYQLCVAFSGEAQPAIQPPTQLHVVDVNTMNYAGLWLENCYLPEAFVAAKKLLTNKKYDVVGAVIPDNESDAIQAARHAGFEFIGHYHWWQRKLK